MSSTARFKQKEKAAEIDRTACRPEESGLKQTNHSSIQAQFPLGGSSLRTRRLLTEANQFARSAIRQ
jgi:hypothetical protein